MLLGKRHPGFSGRRALPVVAGNAPRWWGWGLTLADADACKNVAAQGPSPGVGQESGSAISSLAVVNACSRSVRCRAVGTAPRFRRFE